MVSAYNEKSSMPDSAFKNSDEKAQMSVQNKPAIKNVDFDDLLPYIGSFGTYQKYLFLLMAPYTVFYVFVYFTQIFITLIPNDYWCNVPELSHLQPSDRYTLDIAS